MNIVRDNIMFNEINSIKKGMMIYDVRKILGAPHDNSTKKYLGDVYYLADGSEAAIIYDNYGVTCVIYENNGTRKILLEN